MIDSRLLQTFVVLADELHFGRAADRLMMARSALSAQISRLEDVIGSRLLERNRRAAVTLTRPGEAFLLEAKQALTALDRAERIGRASARLEAGSLRFGYVFTAGINGMLTRGLRTLRDKLPLLDVTPIPMETPEQIAGIASGAIDLGLIRPRIEYPANVRSRVVHREELILLHGHDHAMARLPQLSRNDVHGERFIIPQMGGGTGLTKAVHDLIADDPYRLPPVSTTDFVSAINMAAAGLGVVLAPRCLERLDVAGLRARTIAGFAEGIEMAVAWREGELSSIADLLSLEP